MDGSKKQPAEKFWELCRSENKGMIEKGSFGYIYWQSAESSLAYVTSTIHEGKVGNVKTWILWIIEMVGHILSFKNDISLVWLL